MLLEAMKTLRDMKPGVLLLGVIDKALAEVEA